MKTMTRGLHRIALVAATALPGALLAAVPEDAHERRLVVERLDASIKREHSAGRFDGVMLVGTPDGVVFRRAVGLADRKTRRLHRATESWRLASVSKQVAALLVMQQVEQGRFTLDTTLHELLPDFASPLAEKITLRQLLQHTSGLPNPDASGGTNAADDAMPPFYVQRFDDESGPVDAALAYCAGTPTGVPGARFAYNNCDTLIVQAVLERVTGEPYARLVDQAIAAPLHLTHWRLVTPSRPAPDLPRGYLDSRRDEPAFNLASFGAGGALVGSADDLWKFDQALMSNKLLAGTATREMWTGDPSLGYVALGAWSFSAPLAGCAGSVALVERRGQIGGVQVRNLMAPALGAAVIVFSNTGQTEFGEIWQGKGWMHELASAAFCHPG